MKIEEIAITEKTANLLVKKEDLTKQLGIVNKELSPFIKELKEAFNNSKFELKKISIDGFKITYTKPKKSYKINNEIAERLLDTNPEWFVSKIDSGRLLIKKE